MLPKGICLGLGGVLSSSDVSFDSLIANYSKKCSSAFNRLNSSLYTDEGVGWLFPEKINLDEITKTADKLRDYDYVIQVGIGGSALGNLMLNEIFLGNYPNKSKQKRPEFYLADNPDPAKIADIWEIVKDGSVAIIVVSKSGSTAETMSQFLWFINKLKERGDSLKDNVVVITDSEKGILRPFVNEVNCDSLVVPPTTGGRYSVLSPVGLLSAAVLGIDIKGLVAGAASMRDWLSSRSSIAKNPLWQLAALAIYHEMHNRPMIVMMPYSSRMSYFSEWFAQLWGESLGKNGKGTTPIRAVGSIDQHSQIQLYTQGPDDKFFIILDVKDRGNSVVIPESDTTSLKALSYMFGVNISDMLSMEARSTASAIKKADKPVVFIEIDALSPEIVGNLIFFFEYFTAFTGYMMGINPFDQPGVEQGKRYTYGLMEREGFEEDLEEVKHWFSQIKKTQYNI